MDDFYRNPPNFPLLVKDALAIINSMVTSILGKNTLSAADSAVLATAIRNIVHDSFWGGIHINPKNDDESIRRCLAHVTDADLKSYWTHIGSKRKIPIIRSMIHEIYTSVPYHVNQLQTDINTIKNILVDKCKPMDLELVLKNIKAIAEILILDGNNLSYSFCTDPEAEALVSKDAGLPPISQPLSNQKTIVKPADADMPLAFNLKARLISEKTFYILGVAVVAASGLIVWHIKTKDKKESK